MTARSYWQRTTAIEVLLGSLMVVAIAFLVALILPSPLELTPSMDARTSPGLLDLGVALAAGAAGAYVAARKTGSDALPGVAIAVSLVPPLATVGICLELGRLDDAAGALLLFVTNFAAIVVAACIVFTLAGAAPGKEMADDRHRVRNGVIAAVIALVIIAIPLAWHGIETARSWIRSTTGAPYVRAWVAKNHLSVREWSVEGDQVHLLVAGPDAPSDVNSLATELAVAFGGPVTLGVDYVQATSTEVHAAP